MRFFHEILAFTKSLLPQVYSFRQQLSTIQASTKLKDTSAR